MASREKPEKKPVQQRVRKTNPRQAPKMRVIEAGETEQGEPIELRHERLAGQEAARESQREQSRHGGIPIGSDPRE